MECLPPCPCLAPRPLWLLLESTPTLLVEPPVHPMQMLVQPLDRIFHVIRTNASQVIQALGTQEVRRGPWEGASKAAQTGMCLLHHWQESMCATWCMGDVPYAYLPCTLWATILAGPGSARCRRPSRQPQGRRGHQHHRSGCGVFQAMAKPVLCCLGSCALDPAQHSIWCRRPLTPSRTLCSALSFFSSFTARLISALSSRGEDEPHPGAVHLGWWSGRQHRQENGTGAERSETDAGDVAVAVAPPCVLLAALGCRRRCHGRW